MAERMDDQWPESDRTSTGDATEVEAAVIRAEIVETRERMSDTLSEIGERLNPHVVKEQVTERVKEGIRDATIGRVEHMARNAADKVSDTRSGIADTIRDNPIPAAMVAIGLGWMVLNGRGDSSRQNYRRPNRFSAAGGLASPRYAGDASADYASGAGGVYGSSAYGAYGEAGQDEGVVDRARHLAGDLGSSAKNAAGSVVEGAQSAAGTVAHGAQDVAEAVADRTRRGARRVEDTFYENPLAIGAVSLALGLAAGLAAPPTEREVQLMGNARDRVVDRVKDTVQDKAEKAQHVAERAVQETKNAARDEGLTPTR
jgi:gas vesicle protein